MMMKRMVSMILMCTMLLTTIITPALAEEIGSQTPSEAIKESVVEATQEPTAEPTVEPTEEPTAEPTVEPTQEPTAEPTVEPTQEPTAESTVEPTQEPTAEPTMEPMQEPATEPTVEPAQEPTAELTEEPTPVPAFSPSYVLCRAGVRIYTHLAMKGEYVTLAEDGIIYAYDIVEYEEIEGYEVAYVTEGETERGFLRKESRSECISADRAQQYKSGQSYTVSGITGITLPSVVLEKENESEMTEEPEITIEPETTEEPGMAEQSETTDELEMAIDSEEMDLSVLPTMLLQSTAAGTSELDVTWQEPVLINSETMFYINMLDTEDVRMYINESEAKPDSKNLNENGATVTKTFAEAGEHIIRFETLIGEEWVSSQSYTLNVTSYGEMPVPELRVSAASVETCSSVTFDWDAVEGATEYITGIQEPDSTYISWSSNIDKTKTDTTYSDASLSKKGTYTFWLKVQPAPGYEESTVSMTFEVTTEKIFDYMDYMQGKRAIIGYYGTETDVVIPSEIDGRTITSIWNNAFKNSSVTSVVIPECVTEIRDYAFEGCDSLSEIDLPADLVWMGYHAFANCTSLRKVTIPQSVGNISSGTFQGCTDLTIYGYADSEAETFAAKNGFAFVALDEAGAGDIRFTLDRTEVYEDGWVTLTVTAPNAEKLRVYTDGLTYGDEYEVDDGETQVIRYNISRLGEHSIAVAQKVNGEWLIPCEVQTVLVKALGVPQIQPIQKIVTVGKELTVSWMPVEDAVSYTVWIGKDDFSTQIANTTAELDESGYVSFTLPDTALKEQGDYTLAVIAYAADGGSSRAEATFAAVAQDEFTYSLLWDDTAEITGYNGAQTDIIIPAEIDGHPVKYIGTEAFANSHITSVILPDSVERISTSAFSGCAALTKIDFSDALEYIDMKAFYGCTALREVTLPAGLRFIFSKAFAECTSLTSATIPLNVLDIVDDAFSGCENLEIWGYTGSKAEEFAVEQGFVFHALAAKPEFTLSSYEVSVDEPVKLTLTNMACRNICITYISDEGEYEETYFIFGSEMLTCFFREEGVYRMSVSCENDGVWSEKSDEKTVVVTAAKEPTGKAQIPSFTMELTTWGDIHFAVQAPQADVVQLYIDGEPLDTYDEVVNGEADIYITSPPGIYEFSIRAWQDGEWSELCEAQSFEVPAYAGKLDTPVIHDIGDVSLSDDIWTFTWESVPNAAVYFAQVIRREQNGTVEMTSLWQLTEPEWNFRIGDKYYDFEAGIEYILQVKAATAGYEESEIAEKTFTVQDALALDALDAPVIDPIENILMHQSMKLSWQPVENAESYGVRMWLESNPYRVTILELDTPDALEHIYSATGDMDAGTYVVEVTAKAEGYKPGVSTQKMTIECLGTLEAPQLSMKDVLVVTEENPYATNAVDITKVEGADDYEFVVQFTDYYTAHFSYSNNLPADMGDFVRLHAHLNSWNLDNSGIEIGDEVKVYALSCADGYVYGKSAMRTVKLVAEFEYEIVDGGAVITAYNGYGPSVNVPSKLGGYPVTAIGNGAFEGNDTITSVSLPESVTAIGARAFKNCTALERITGRGVTYVGAEAFSGCTKLTYVDFSEALSEVGENAFQNTGVVMTPNRLDITIDYGSELKDGQYADNPMLGSVRYAEGITVIPTRTHYHNVNLGYAYLPSTLQIIGAQAFAEDGSLIYVRLYDGITSIADNAFDGSPGTEFEIFVRDLDTISYAEQYAIDHNIPYTKTLYSDSAPEAPDVIVEGEEIEWQTDTEFTVQVNRQISFHVVGEAADKVVVYLDDKVIAEQEFLSGNVMLPYTFTETGDYHLYAISYNGDEASEKTLDKIVHVVGLTFSVDKEDVWTCEKVHFDVGSSNLSGIVRFYADGEQFAEAVLENGQASVDYGFTKTGERVIRVEVGTISSIEKVVTVKSLERLAVPVVQVAAIQPYRTGLTLSWNAVEHADGYVVHVINANGETFYRTDIEADGSDTQTFTITAEQLQGAGSYAVFVMDYGYQYDQNESEAVSVMMVEEDGLMFAMDKTAVRTGETVRFTVAAPGAESVQLLVDGETYEVYALADGSAEIERVFHQSGERQIAFRALRDGEWSEVCAAQALTVISAGKLDSAQIVVNAYQLLGSGVDVSWNAVEHADGYTLYVLDANGTELYREETNIRKISIPSKTFSACGIVEIVVMAYGSGYDQSRSAAQTEIVDRLPGPVILTPEADEMLSAHTCMVTWEPVDGAQSYVITLARRTDDVDANGQPVYEKVWASPNEVVNVGGACTYMLEGLAYGEAYRVAVGAVLEGTGMEDATKVGWTERRFTVGIPSLVAEIALSPSTAYEKQEVTVTVTVNHAQSVAVLSDGVDILTPVRDETTENSHTFEFKVRQNRQGIYAYTVTVKGTGDIEKAEWIEKSFNIEFLDANKPVISAVEMEPDPCWPEMDVKFEITGNEFTEYVDVYLHKGSEQILLGTTEAEYDTLFGVPQKRIFSYVYRFAEVGEHTLHFTPHNSVNPAEDEYGDPFERTFTVLSMGQLPNPVIEDLKNGDILIDEENTVTWNTITTSNGMPFGGYCVLLEKKTANGYELVPGYVYKNTGKMTSCVLSGLEAGAEYRLHVFALEDGHAEPDGKLHGETVVEFGYRTVPGFALKSVTTEGNLHSPITVTWEAPVWPGNPALKPTKYVVWWYGAGLPYNETTGTNAMAFMTSGDATSFTLDGDYTAIDGYYSVCVYAILSISEGESAQTMAEGYNSIEIAKPQIDSIWFQNEDKTGGRIVDIVDPGEMEKNLTFTVRVKGDVKAVKVYINGVFHKLLPVANHSVIVSAPMYAGEINTLEVSTEDGVSSKKTYIAMCEWLNNKAYAGANGIEYLLWPEEGEKADGTLPAETELKRLGACNGYYLVDLGTKWRFVPGNQTLEHMHSWMRQVVQESIIFTFEDSDYHRVSCEYHEVCTICGINRYAEPRSFEEKQRHIFVSETQCVRRCSCGLTQTHHEWNKNGVCKNCGITEKDNYFKTLMNADQEGFNPLCDEGFVESLRNRIKNAYGVTDERADLIIDTIKKADPLYRELYLYSIYNYELSDEKSDKKDKKDKKDDSKEDSRESFLSYYSPKENTIYFSDFEVANNTGFLRTWFHESGHALELSILNDGRGFNTNEIEAYRSKIKELIVEDVKNKIDETMDIMMLYICYGIKYKWDDEIMGIIMDDFMKKKAEDFVDGAVEYFSFDYMSYYSVAKEYFCALNSVDQEAGYDEIDKTEKGKIISALEKGERDESIESLSDDAKALYATLSKEKDEIISALEKDESIESLVESLSDDVRALYAALSEEKDEIISVLVEKKSTESLSYIAKGVYEVVIKNVLGSLIGGFDAGVDNTWMVWDLYAGVTSNQISLGEKGGHPVDYWYDKAGNLNDQINQEAWAEFFAAKITRAERHDKQNEAYFEETYPVLEAYAEALLAQYKAKAAAEYK